MLYTIVSDNKAKFENNPFVITVVANVSKFKKNETYLIHTFEKAVKLFEKADYISNTIEENIYWFEDSIDDIVRKHFLEVEDCQVIPCLSMDKIPENLFNYSNQKLKTFFDKDKFYLIDKNIFDYFESNAEYVSALNFKNTFRLKLKQLGVVNTTLEMIENYVKQLFPESYWKYILVVYSMIADEPEKFIAEYEYKGVLHNTWNELFKVEDYLNQTKIYGLTTRSIDLDFIKDEKNKFYVQYQYSGSENTTGRIFTINLNGYQALQNLPKDVRHILKAEKNCVLVEMDYKSFEFAILACMLRHKTEGDPHQIMIDNLFPNKKLDRQLGKDINYSVIYGKTIETIARELVEKFPDEDYFVIEKKLRAQELFQKVGVFSSVLRQNNFKKGRMLLKNYFNRWIKVEKEWALLNNFIQSTGADFLYLKFNLIVDVLKKHGGKNKILLQNHDSILFQFEDKTIDETDMFETILEIMEAPFEDIKVDVEYKVGRNWGQMS